MTAREVYDAMLREPQGAARQRWLNEFVDELRRARGDARTAMVAEDIPARDALSALVAATVETLCVEAGIAPPDWTDEHVSPEPYFAFGAQSFPLRVRLMIDAPPAFKRRRVFVPDTFLQRA